MLLLEDRTADIYTHIAARTKSSRANGGGALAADLFENIAEFMEFIWIQQYLKIVKMSLERGRVAEPDQAGRTASLGGPEAGVLSDGYDPSLTVKSSLLLRMSISLAHISSYQFYHM